MSHRHRVRDAWTVRCGRRGAHYPSGAIRRSADDV